MDGAVLPRPQLRGATRLLESALVARQKLDKGTRVILATAAVVCGLVAGIVVIAVLSGRGGGESSF